MAKRTAGPATSGEVAEPAADRELLVLPAAGAPLSRLQRTFNGLVQELAELERRLATGRDDLELLLERYQKRVAKRDRELAQAQFALAAALAAAHRRLQLRGNQKQDLAAMLCDLCEDAFLTTAPDAETEALYEEWSGHGYREALGRAGPAPGDAGGGGEDSEAGAGHEGGESSAGEEGAGAAEHDWSRRDSRRGGDFAAREARRAEQQALTRRSVREVYLSLARVLHPDAVTEPSERRDREEAMKQATGAYGRQDLLALLRLELRWIRRGNDRGEGPGDDTLRAYIRALRQQVARLEDAIAMQAADPRYDPVAGLAVLPRSRALAELDDRARQLRAATAELVELRAMVHASGTRQELAAIVRGARHHRAR